MSEEPFRPENGCEFGSDAPDVEQHCRRRDGVFRGKQRIPLGLHCLDLFEQQFEPVEFAANLGLQMIRQRATIAGLELFQPLQPIATKRVVFGYPLGEQKPFDSPSRL